jgi:hypothetical protein
MKDRQRLFSVSGTLLLTLAKGEQEGDEEKTDERQKRNRDKTQPIDILTTARYSGGAREDLLHSRHFLFQIVIERNAHSHDAQRPGVGNDSAVASIRCHPQENGQRVHADPLEPTEFAGLKQHDFAEKQAPAQRCDGYQPSEVEIVRAQEPDHFPL